MTAAADNTISATVVILGALTDRTFRGTLPNGREIFIFVQRMSPLPRITPGDTIIAELSLGDFSRGRFVQLVVPKN